MGNAQGRSGFSVGHQLKWLAYGYRVGEVKLKEIGAVKEGTKLDRFVLSPEYRRPVMLFSLGCHMEGVCLPTPDITSSKTLLAGVAARFATRPPEPDPNILEQFRSFVAAWLEKNLVPLSSDTDVSFETWLDNVNQPDWRKKELEEARRRWLRPSRKHFDVKMFMKKESYVDFKHGRAINSRSDEFKTMVGPIFSAIEHEVFKLPEFIKKVPVLERARYVYERINRQGSLYYASDFTSFEALFTRQIMEASEFQLYRHMTSKLPEGADFMKLIEKALLGVNKIKNKNLSLRVEATRMSGEMCTSLGNGFSNLMFNLFVCHKSGVDVVGVVEGDDGLFRVSAKPDVSLFEKLGLIIKTEFHEDPSLASFCGQIFDPSTYTVITDPRKVLASVGWIDGKYALASVGKQMGLLRAKAWSFGYQYPACPVISAMSRALLRLTRSHDHRYALKDTSLGYWMRNLMQEAFDSGRPELNQPIHDDTRALMERVFGITPEVQKQLEEWFDNLVEIKPFPQLQVPDSWKAYFEKYVVPTRSMRFADIPPETWPACVSVTLPKPFSFAQKNA